MQTRWIGAAIAVLAACGGPEDNPPEAICERVALEAEQLRAGNFLERIETVNESQVLAMAEKADMTGDDITELCGARLVNEYRRLLDEALEP